MNLSRPVLAILSVCMACIVQAQPVTVSSTDFSPVVVYRSVEIKALARASDNMLVHLAATKHKQTGAVVWAVVMQGEYSGHWRFYESVSLVGGKLLPAPGALRQVGGCSGGSCSLFESAKVHLDADDVRAGLADGLKIRWNPQSLVGSFEVVLPASHFAELAEALAR